VRLDQIVIDSCDPPRLARFWAALLEADPVDREGGWSHVQGGDVPRISFQPVLERRRGKNRLHLDLEVDDIETAVAVAQALGAHREGVVVTTHLGAYQVMADPEGNKFCFVCD